MKTLLLSLLLVVVSFGAVNAQCPAGDITLTTQNDVDQFINNYPSCTSVDGNLLIDGNLITNLNGLSSVTTISGFLEIGNTQLTSLAGLSALTNVSGLAIFDNQNLTSLNGLSDNLEITDYLSIQSNNQLSTCGFRGICSALTNDAYLSISSNGEGCAGGDISADCEALPVTLTQFEAVAEHNTAVLEWNTSTEFQSNYFEVQASKDSYQWRSIGNVTAGYKTQQSNYYSFHHTSPDQGENYYRLKMVDRDGTFAYSIIRSVYFQTLGAYVYPNPVAEIVYLKNETLDQVINVELFDLYGKSVLMQNKRISEGVSLRSLNSGVYICVVNKIGGASHSFRVIKN